MKAIAVFDYGGVDRAWVVYRLDADRPDRFVACHSYDGEAS